MSFDSWTSCDTVGTGGGGWNGNGGGSRALQAAEVEYFRRWHLQGGGTVTVGRLRASFLDL